MTAPVVGVLAGMGPRSTGPFIDLLLEQCRLQYGALHDVDFPKFFICSQPAPFYEDRATDYAGLESATIEGLLDLERAGADFAVIACNTAHMYHEAAASQLSIRVLNMIEIVCADIACNYGVGKIAVVASADTISSRLYCDALEATGCNAVEVTWQTEVNHLLSLVKTGRDPSELCAAWNSIDAKIMASGADLALIACLDASAVVGYRSPSIPHVDAAVTLAARTISTWLSMRQLDKPAEL
ncbi:aspartate/glutamate racemase family protein [Streptomyces cinereoruber]|uniref:aspartate/glutamate racemase family protein n=1 Tax=Streptomyces cinereoruber TaxID=67260 RepID=UPI00362BA776